MPCEPQHAGVLAPADGLEKLDRGAGPAGQVAVQVVEFRGRLSATIRPTSVARVVGRMVGRSALRVFDAELRR